MTAIGAQGWKRARRLIAASLAMFAALAWSGAAAGPLVTLQATASSELANDEMVVELAAERSGPSAEKLNAEVIAAMNAAIATAKTRAGVAVRAGPVTTHPDWGPDGRRNGWRVRGVVVLEGRDLQATAALAGELANDLQIRNVTFGLTDSTRSQAQSRLLKEAAAAFGERAKETAAAFGFAGYELKTLNVDHAASQPTPRPIQSMLRSASAAPSLPTEGGEATVTLTISGSIELK